jgi:photosystem II stability/assembly factor-like uncharacterized protein
MTRGLDVTTSYGVHADPFAPSTLFITYSDIGLFRSATGGASWHSAIAGIPAEWRNTAYDLAFDPQRAGLIWGAFSGTHDLPRPKMWRRRSPETFRGGVAVSSDGGQTWKPSNRGMIDAPATHLLLDPSSPPGRRTLYACSFGRGVYKSTDNGRRWTLKNQGIRQAQPFAWRMARAADGTLYVVLARRSEGGEIGGEGDGALYRSTDGAERWTPVSLPPGVNGPNGLAVDPSDGQRLYLAAWGVRGKLYDSGGGVFRSTDGGRTWEHVFDGSQHVYDVTLDPRDPRTLYACGFEGAAYRSADAGTTWTRLRGYNFKWGHRVIPDPSAADQVYITTFGGSVWRGPALGDEAAVEDIVPARPAGSRAGARHAPSDGAVHQDGGQ